LFFTAQRKLTRSPEAIIKLMVISTNRVNIILQSFEIPKVNIKLFN